jgi:hypothetical protein
LLLGANTTTEISAERVTVIGVKWHQRDDGATTARRRRGRDVGLGEDWEPATTPASRGSCPSWQLPNAAKRSVPPRRL